ncbi:hypothetical protein SKAU_G00265900 [Synaphobranchus kaupii]|uniref:Uncharacterized protein n=1 Tax=Synaphobranchus kaupii TaxID=118154 RepID=A0A9Q1IQ37_SYNKA|nr:hypothetical protein SKAU_G00265900 [Synaphobranchus kaupii]
MPLPQHHLLMHTLLCACRDLTTSRQVKVPIGSLNRVAQNLTSGGNGPRLRTAERREATVSPQITATPQAKVERGGVT